MKKRRMRRRSEKQLCFAQEKVMEGYRRRGAIKNDDEASRLHMFFSPMRVPKRLTNNEIRLCLLMSHERAKQRQQGSVDTFRLVHGPFLLPAPLNQQVMTRKSFKNGFWKFLQTLT